MISTTPTREAWNVRGEKPRIPEGDRRNPIAFVDLMIGQDWGVTVAVQHQKNAGLIMRLPTAPDGGPGIRPSAALMAAMQLAAVQAVKADPVAHEHLTQTHPAKRRKVGGKRPRADA